MIDQSLVQSGFDAEVLIGNRYIQYLLLNAIETGSLQTEMSIPYVGNSGPSELLLNIYVPLDYERVYTPDPLAIVSTKEDIQSFYVEILSGDPTGADLRITVVADVTDTALGINLSAQVIELYTTFQLATSVDDNGNQRNAKMKIELVAIEGFVIEMAVALGGITKSELIDMIKPDFDRTVDLGIVGPDQNVQAVHMKKLEPDGDHPRCIGLYLNLKLREGPQPDSFLPDRGNLDDALNFLPSGEDIAFGMPGSLYNKLGNDAFQKMAEETSDGSGVYIYPIHENPNNKNSEIKGELFGIRMYAENGSLVIEVTGEYYMPLLPNAGFSFYIYVKPVVTPEGLIEWELDYDLEISDVYKYLAGWLGVFLAILFGPAGFIAGGIITLAVVGGQELIAEPLALKMIEEEADSMVDASFFDAIPARLTIETKRWDPFYKTHHQIVAKTDKVQITGAGIGFSGIAMLDKQSETITTVVIRTEDPANPDSVNALWYKVPNLQDQEHDFDAHFPGTDRMSYVQITNDAETDLYALSFQECVQRIELSRLHPMIPYTAKKIHMVNNQVDHILVISNRELRDHPDDWHTLLRLDLSPENLALLQRSKLLFLEGLVIVERLGKPYYRDKADGYKPDNLLSLPRYNP